MITITKGIVQNKVVGSNKYVVSIPYLQQSSVKNNGVTESVLEATLAHTPGIINSYNDGDVVFIGFEQGQTGKPIILGKLLLDENDNRGFAQISSLDVADKAVLPEDTKIGDVDFKTISGDLERLQFEIDNTDNDFVKDVLYDGESVVDSSGVANITPFVKDVQLNGTSILSNKVANVKALPNYNLTIGTNPAGMYGVMQVKFLSIDYNNYTSESSAFFKLSAQSGHGNGSSYQFLEDIIIGCSYTGNVTCQVFKHLQISCGNVDGVSRYYGDVFYVKDETNKIVDFYILIGQFTTSNYTPLIKIGNTTTNGTTQLTGTQVRYSSGTKVWASGDCTTYARINEVQNLIPITWQNLKDLRDNSGLLPGAFYRITDYACTTTQTKTSSAGHQFDIIVRADDINKLNEVASAIQHSGDTYFSASKLDAWKIWYCLDNDTSRFNWADTTNGKGVIYRMMDEFNNEAPYDFKNILFTQNGSITVTTSSVTAVLLPRNKSGDINNLFCYSNGNVTVYVSDIFPTTASVLKDASGEELPSSKINKLAIDYTNVYTFSGTVNNNIVDASLNEGNLKCLNNILKVYNDSRKKQYLNNNVLYSQNNNSNFYHNVFEYDCRNNTILSSYLCSLNILHSGCYSNIFNIKSNVCYYNTLETYCYGNYFEGNCHTNTFGNGCYANVFLFATINKLGNDCYNNTFGGSYNIFGNGCNGNTFGTNCWYNTFGNACYRIISESSLSRNIFGNYCRNITLGNSCAENSFGNGCTFITFGTSASVKDFYNYNIIDSGCSYIYLDSSTSTSASSPLQNVHIHSGVKGSASQGRKTITVAPGLSHSMDVYAVGSETMNV